MSAAERLPRLWYGPAWRSLPVWPLEWIFRLAVAVRRALYASGILRPVRIDVPVIVVGNLTVGGAGKTPVTAWLVRQLEFRGHRVGVVLRGYGGRRSRSVHVVEPGDGPREVGDEALLHAAARPHVVVIGADRVAAAQRAAECGAAIVVCDDGLQHLRLARDLEVVVVDAERAFGNGHMLPAGPLREPPQRLERAQVVVRTWRGTCSETVVHPHHPFVVDARFTPGDAVNLRSGERRALESFRGTAVHAVAGIGHPGAFFEGLRAAGLTVTPHALPDHAGLDVRRPPFPRDAVVLMTGKDAVKCRDDAGPGWWSVELDVDVAREATRDLVQLVLGRVGLTGAGVELG
jgi:tetraacyldisaccharide 4'-kinase